MASYLSVLIDCPDEGFACHAEEQLNADTRAIFSEDVPVGATEIFAAVEELEYPGTLVREGRRLFVEWRQKESAQMDALAALLAIDGVNFIAGFEVPDYAECADDGDPFEDDEFEIAWYWLPSRQGLHRFTRQEAVQYLARDVAERLRPVLDDM